MVGTESSSGPSFHVPARNNVLVVRTLRKPGGPISRTDGRMLFQGPCVSRTGGGMHVSTAGSEFTNGEFEFDFIEVIVVVDNTFRFAEWRVLHEAVQYRVGSSPEVNLGVFHL